MKNSLFESKMGECALLSPKTSPAWHPHCNVVSTERATGVSVARDGERTVRPGMLDGVGGAIPDVICSNTGGIGTFPANAYNFSGEYGPATFATEWRSADPLRGPEISV